MKKSFLTLALAGVLAVGGTVLVFADGTEVVSCFGRNESNGVQVLMDEGLTFEEAKAQRLEEKFERVDAAVERGGITSEEAAGIKAEMESNSAQCTTPGEKQEECNGYGLNQGACGNGSGKGYGKGQGNGIGAGMGLRDGSCGRN